MNPFDRLCRSFVKTAATLAGTTMIPVGVFERKRTKPPGLCSNVGTSGSPLHDVVPAQVDLSPNYIPAVPAAPIANASCRL